MPMYHFECCKYHHLTKRVMTAEEYAKLSGGDQLDKKWIACPELGTNGKPCGYLAQRKMTGGSTKTLEKIDSGLMARPVERLADAERIFSERAAKHTLEHRDPWDRDPDA